jgi:large subunit ribosomal protein L28
MAKVCDICGKGPLVGNQISHSDRKTKRRWMPNLQNARVVGPNGMVTRKRVCTSCLSAGKVAKAVRGASGASK